MGTGYHHHLNFHLHLPHIHFHHHGKKEEMRNIPKGCLAILVGQEGEEQQKFVIPVIYINHPLFMQLLKEAEEEYGFDQKGPITLPCHVEEFRTVQGMIDKDRSLLHHHHHHHHHHVWCFRA
ncbi:auxin-responsive protein saur32-like [Citrus sinensis]|uniref:Auxin-responsive protein saur32-like n=1 Tax=Citrus sinensis TaxID=2711 RepID=A0ACB8M346_CITSI|nr:auxin-responsive protein saur32-like [Citrus sinensis]